MVVFFNQMRDMFSNKDLKKTIIEFQIVLSMISKFMPATLLKRESNTGVLL